MKILKMSLVSLAFILVLTACGSGNKKLTCTQKASEDGFAMSTTITVEFNKEKPAKVKMVVKTSAESKEMKDAWGTMADLLKEGLGAETSKPGISVNGKNDAKAYSYTITYDIDIAKASKEDLEEMDMDDVAGSNETYDSIKKSATSDGFTCK